MTIPRRSLLVLPALAALPRPARAQAYPSRFITLVTGYAPGGGTDVAARVLADAMPRHLAAGARIVVENRPGGAGAVASEWLTRQLPDGHTLMLTETGAALAAPVVVVGGTRYDPIEDFTHLGFISRPPAVLVVTPSIAAATPRETIARLRAARSGTMSYASSGFGGMIHLWGEMVARHLGNQAVHVPYRSGGQMVQSIMTGETQFGVSSMASAVPLIRESRVKPVALIGDTRFPPMPELPTLGELGIEGFETGSLFMVVGPPRMPEALATTINSVLMRTLAEPAVGERLLTAGLPVPAAAQSPIEARGEMERHLARMRAIVEQTGIQAQP
ncbi:Bug family tripartite tricarboxylate transporter substrate binding protein [Plastoroseomonas hellenica]|uniref:Bug family tripartite tricarboxylate transporter substrate binding protein n=1 Tax=Plastoroseomonas hellenica TaxID=2687306 RepID=UPI001BABFFC7|nr:tripartite tricarboxylate transporter substrate binding protein [Plastoroseomonas hellenica]MBR0641320.1 tripartite tricarboxylate transporter substrate binding protein [Plastoroseomonas hellenica]